MRKPQCTLVHEDFRIKRNAEITLLGRPLAVCQNFIPSEVEGAPQAKSKYLPPFFVISSAVERSALINGL